MRVIKEFRDPRMKISIFSFNEKWIVKTEAGLCEQTYKYPQDEWSFEQVVDRCEDEGFKTHIAARFETMHAEMMGTS
jgi:hypothetical protein